MQAVLKGDKMDDVVRDAVMLGVAAIQPIVTKRTESTVAALMRGARLDRWRRVALASVKQSRRAVLPEIRTPLTFETWLDEPPSALRLMLVEPGAAAAGRAVSVLLEQPAPADAAICRRARRRLDRGGVVGRGGARRPAGDAGTAHAARRRGAGRRDQRAAVPLGGSLNECRVALSGPPTRA